MKTRFQLPEIYSQLLPEAFWQLSRVEKSAHCADCVMCKSSQKPFLKETKCCTYSPFLANYLIGGILLSAPSVGQKRIQNKILYREWALPIGLVASPNYQRQFQNKSKEDFGRRFDLKCDFYISSSGECAVWKWRDSQCSTYFCRYDQPDGATFWSQIQTYLYDIELHLAQLCLLEAGFHQNEIEENLRWVYLQNEVENQAFQAEVTALKWTEFWQHQQDRIEEYYKKCYIWVQQNQSQLKLDAEKIFFKHESQWNELNR